MCTEKYHGQERATGLLMLHFFFRKLQRGLSFLAAARGISDHDDQESDVPMSSTVPDDVKEGHFAVFAAKSGERKRFVAKLECLNSPAFLRLLEQAEEEFGLSKPELLSFLVGRRSYKRS
ncbi:hypothetical protein TIFTF001_008443 [Ficus carica]|uniref:Uncharacterized protein n=1 Tax=Ficus carica TaxID=3494 RepID=A0AA87ZT28_FICCA|nr:hypothetical protein TIFTF001_008443 [Ficus carica]